MNSGNKVMTAEESTIDRIAVFSAGANLIRLAHSSRVYSCHLKSSLPNLHIRGWAFPHLSATPADWERFMVIALSFVLDGLSISKHR